MNARAVFKLTLACLISFGAGAIVTFLLVRALLTDAPAEPAPLLDPQLPSRTTRQIPSPLPRPVDHAAIPAGQSPPVARAQQPHSVPPRVIRSIPPRLASKAGAASALNPVPEALPAPQPDHNYFAGSPTFAVKGKIYLRGVPPPEKQLPLDPLCAQEHPNGATTRFYAVAPDGGLADVLVFISEGLPDAVWPMPNQPHLIAQRGCLYEPYISAARAGQSIEIRNLSPVLHNVHLMPNLDSGNPEKNLAQMPRVRVQFTLPLSELFVRLKCDIHPWEFHYLSTFNHPFFAITDDKGEFTLPALPKGQYTLEVRHRKAGLQQLKLEVNSDLQPVTLHFQVPAEI